MRDLELWRRLHGDGPRDGPAGAASLAALLLELAKTTLPRRAAFLADAADLTGDDDAQVRAAAVAVLGGARGPVGVRAIVAALDDDDDAVRLAAVEALRATALDAPLRWLHAVFHPRPDVRRSTLERPPPQAAHLGVYLRADPACADLAAQTTWAPGRLALLFDFLLRDVIEPEVAADAIIQTSVGTLRDFLLRVDRRSVEEVNAFADAAERDAELPVARGKDVLDLCAALADRVPQRRAALLRAVRDAVLVPGERHLRLRAVVALLDNGRKAELSPEAAEVVAACEPAFFGFAGTSVAIRRHATADLWRHRERMSRVALPDIHRLLRGPLVWREDGTPDVRVAIALVGLGPYRFIDTLTAAIGEKTLSDAVRGDPRVWLLLCRLPFEFERLALLDEIGTREPVLYPVLAAITLVVSLQIFPDERLEFQPWVSPKHRLPTLWALGELDATGALGTTTGISKSAVRLASLMALEELQEAVGAMLGAPTPTRAGVAFVLAAFGRLHPPQIKVLAAALSAAEAEALASEVGRLYPISDEHRQAVAAGLRDQPGAAAQKLYEEVFFRAPPIPAAERGPVASVHNLSLAERDRIATCDAKDLEAALGPALEVPTRGLADALARRPAPGTPHLAVCVALLACIDGLAPVARELERFGTDEADFGRNLHAGAVTMWLGSAVSPPWCDAWLYEWEQHVGALGLWIDAAEGGLRGALEEIAAAPCVWFQRKLWRATVEVMALRRARAPGQLKKLVDTGLVALLVDHLDTALGEPAARALAVLHRSGLERKAMTAARVDVLALGPVLDRATRFELAPWVDIEVAAPSPTSPHRALPAATRRRDLHEVQSSSDTVFLSDVCRRGAGPLVAAAIKRLIALGEPGHARLEGLLYAEPAPACAEAVAASVGGWKVRAFADRAREAARDPATRPDLRHRIAVAMIRRGERGWTEVAIASALAPAPTWFTRDDWERLLGAPKTEEILVALCASPHPNAFDPAVRRVLASADSGPERMAALRAFLERGMGRPTQLRRRAARRLKDDDFAALPVLITDACDPTTEVAAELLVTEKGAVRHTGSWTESMLMAVVGAAVTGGKSVCSEDRAVDLMLAAPRLSQGRARELLLLEAVDDAARKRVAAELPPSAARSSKLADISEIFAWGVRRGRELTGRLYAVHMTAKRADFGYTPMSQRRVFVTPLPVLRGDRHGRDVVEGLILHEFGHHMYHRGAKAGRVWRRAKKESLFSVLNLVADEHLERNLRALEPEFGDRLKRLAAYAFQHASRDVRVEQLLAMLRGDAFEVLTSLPLGVAYAEDSVVLQSGRLLHALEQRGNSFARFVRALRMGLGARHSDPRVQAGLDLFKGGFRRSDMGALYRVTKRLSEIFGSEVSLADGFAGHEGIEWDDREAEIHGDGISDEEVQREVERILEPPKKTGRRGDMPGGAQINVGPNERFPRITKITPKVPDIARHREETRHVRRHAHHLREYLERLGLSLVPRRPRIRGRMFDRTRARAVVLRGDPRMLIARAVEVKSDLFIGCVIDCSGSMHGQNIERARRFGVLIAEAARGLPGVDARFFGFTDSEIFDAGDAQSCAVTSLEAGGGNNDAAALDHAASVAYRSKRRAKLLVMISDGLPTECSVDALKALVDRLGRRHAMCCAQVAVRPLSEVCFPHYVVIDQTDVGVAVHKFGQIVARLVRRALER